MAQVASPRWRNAALLLLLCVVWAPALAQTAQGCIRCHPNHSAGFSPSHSFAAQRCSECHGGNPDALQQTMAHKGLAAFPGNLSNARQRCGNCHPDRVAQVLGGLMHTGLGIVATTRRVMGETDAALPPGGLGNLGHGPADSLLRKLCASCHLGHDKTKHQSRPLFDRGGGCLACHLGDSPSGAHPTLSAKVADRRCLGCHSRSGRISLNYAGLAEVDASAEGREDPATLGRLQDGRLVQHAAADVHQRAGMGCSDCHTATGLMGSGPRPASLAPIVYQAQAVDIACRDCHDNRAPRVAASALGKFRKRIPYPTGPSREFLVTKRFRTPLWNLRVVQAADTERLVLYAKNGTETNTRHWEIPPYTSASHPLAAEHRRLHCDACHSQWAPQCYGCHLRFDPAGTQWDHIEGRPTPGRWQQQAADFQHHLPTLGVDAEERIVPFVPGMVLSMDHPAWEAPRFGRWFASLAPHTVGKSRPCASCHRNPVALGLGRGRLERCGQQWSFEPTSPVLGDGLPGDAWTTLDAARPGQGTRPGERSFTAEEMRRVLAVPVPPP